MFSKKKLTLSSTETKEYTFLVAIFSAMMLVLVLASLTSVEYKLNTIISVINANGKHIAN